VLGPDPDAIGVDYAIGEPEWVGRGLGAQVLWAWMLRTRRRFPDAIGVDYAIGEVEWVGRGLGVQVLWAWMLRTHRRRPEVRAYFAAPDHRNAASLRVLAKAGFTEGVWFDEPNRQGGVDTVVGCTLDVPRVLG